MGRGGGSSGGGGFSSGGGRGFSNHHSSGSHRGGSSSFGGGNSGSSRSSPNISYSSKSILTPRPPRSRRLPKPLGSSMYSHTTIYTSSGPRSGNKEMPKVSPGYKGTQIEKQQGIPGWFKWLCCFTVVIIVFMMIFSISAMKKAKNTHPREKLGAEAAISSSYVIGDEIGWISKSKTVTNGMDYFYEKTGVRPYLLICDNLDGKSGKITDVQAETSLNELYNTLFRDEGHMIFAFMEYAESKYITYLYTGTAADSVMDPEAREIFLSNADRFYSDSSLSDEEFFSRVFRASADSIMKDASGTAAAARMCLALSILAAIAMAVGFIIFKVAEEKRKGLEQANQLLSTPVPETKESAADEALLEKYLKDEGE